MPGALRITFSMPQKQPPATIATSCLPLGVNGFGSAEAACSVEQAASARATSRILRIMQSLRASSRVGYARPQLLDTMREVPDLLAIVSKAIFDRDARGRSLGDVWPVDRYT